MSWWDLNFPWSSFAFLKKCTWKCNVEEELLTTFEGASVAFSLVSWGTRTTFIKPAIKISPPSSTDLASSLQPMTAHGCQGLSRRSSCGTWLPVTASCTDLHSLSSTTFCHTETHTHTQRIVICHNKNVMLWYKFSKIKIPPMTMLLCDLHACKTKLMIVIKKCRLLS